MRHIHTNRIILLLVAGVFLFSSGAFAQEAKGSASPAGGQRLGLVRAAMCEDVQDSGPLNAGVCFSASIGKVFCFTAFDSVPEKTIVYHNWFHRDKLSTRKRLSLQAPRSSVFSTILLREADKGPWRVEAVDEKGNLISILRFSITE